jgi:hypothetical protein
MAESPSCDLAIVGAGVSGCAVAAQLRRLGWSGSIQLLEIGRGPGGRCATRRSRHDADLAINHGAPLFNISGEPPALLEPLERGSWILPFAGAIQWLDDDGRCVDAGPNTGGIDDPGLLRGALWQGRGGMDQICRGLLELAGATAAAPLAARYGTLVRRLEPLVGGSSESEGWILRDADDGELTRCGWLVLSGTLLAHPRCKSVFGWPEVPLQEAAATLADPQLERASRQLAKVESTASSNLLLTLQPAEAAAWLALPWRLLQLTASAQRRWGLRRITIQPLADGRCAVVAESSPAFAADHRHVYGSRSSAAQLLGAAPDASAEQATLDALQTALETVVGLAVGSEASHHRQLMRWGAAFPQAGRPGLPSDLQLCRRSRIGFCGDAVTTTPGLGRVEGALRSAESLAASWLEL